MKSCKKCGIVNDNINRYCRHCGTSFDEAEALAIKEAEPVLPCEAEPVVQKESELLISEEGNALFSMILPVIEEEPQYIDFDLGEDEEDDSPLPSDPRRRLADATRTAPFVIFAVLYSLGFALSVMGLVLRLISPDTGLMEAFYDLVYAMLLLGFERMGAYGVASFVAPITLAVEVCLLLTVGVFLLGLWLYFGGIRGEGNTSRCGLSFMSTACIVGCILCALGVLCTGIVGLGVLMARLSATPESVPMLNGLIILLAVIGVALVIGVIYHCLALGSLSRIKNIIRGSDSDHRLSIFVMVVNLLGAIALSAVAGFFMGGGNILDGITATIYMITLASLTLIMARLRMEIKEK